jgi:nicotinamide phosphoribosyltransferase
MTISAATMQKDVYKEFHVRAYHPQVSRVYVNYTSRSNRLCNIKDNESIVFVGLQYFIKDYLIEEWNESFFNLPVDLAVANHKRILSAMLGYSIDVTYLESLHALGYLPIRIKALKEGSLVPYQVAPLTIVNTIDGFEWLPNMIETVLSTENWPIQTSATTSVAYMRNFKKAFEDSGMDKSLLPFMCHDFSFRGMFGRQAAAMSGFGHLCSGFAGTDTIPAVLFAEKYYNANVDNELVGCSVDATEHSVTCSWQDEGEIEFFTDLMTKQSPTGILSVVSDTWDFWKTVTEYLPILKDVIMARDGKLVIRPDSGDPVDILCGTSLAVGSFSPESRGLIECLWDTFGGTTTEKGFKLLDSHIGAIYGDAITIERQLEINRRLMAKGFCPQAVLGVGSYSFQYVTRDTHGSAVKATNVIKNGVSTPIFKDPKTDTSKKSAKGLLRVEFEGGKFVMYDQQTSEQEGQGKLELVFENGNLTRETSLSEIRSLINNQI